MFSAGIGIRHNERPVDLARSICYKSTQTYSKRIWILLGKSEVVFTEAVSPQYQSSAPMGRRMKGGPRLCSPRARESRQRSATIPGLCRCTHDVRCTVVTLENAGTHHAARCWRAQSLRVLAADVWLQTRRTRRAQVRLSAPDTAFPVLREGAGAYIIRAIAAAIELSSSKSDLRFGAELVLFYLE